MLTYQIRSNALAAIAQIQDTLKGELPALAQDHAEAAIAQLRAVINFVPQNTHLSDAGLDNQVTMRHLDTMSGDGLTDGDRVDINDWAVNTLRDLASACGFPRTELSRLVSLEVRRISREKCTQDRAGLRQYWRAKRAGEGAVRISRRIKNLIFLLWTTLPA